MDDRNCEGWAEEGHPHMGETVSVPPSLVVTVGDVGGGYGGSYILDIAKAFGR